MIASSSIELVLNTSIIEDVVGDYLSLKKRGANYTGICPFHDEKTPSFYVSPSKGIFKCFGCGKGGNAANFVMEMEQVNFFEAIRRLAKKYNIQLEESLSTNPEFEEKEKLRESLYIALSHAENFYHEQLINHEVGKTIGLAYFRERGFTRQTIDKFRLGFATEDWSSFADASIKNKFNPEVLEKAGLIKKNEKGGYFDLFRNRVIFPIYGVSGKVIGFAGRVMGKAENTPKYVNSPETEVYHKSDQLYGLFHAKQAIKRHDVCYLVEGYTDVITLHQAGIENVVSSSGTSLTEGQIKLISRFTKNITVLYDGDTAGIKASLRGINMLLENGLNVKVVLFPEGEDPDSYCKKLGSEEFILFLQQKAQDFILFKAGLLLAETANDPVARSAANRDILESIGAINDPLTRMEFVKQLATTTGSTEQLLTTELNKIVRKRRFPEAKELDKQIQILTDETPGVVPEIKLDDYDQEKALLKMIILYGHLEYEDEHRVLDVIMHELFEGNDFVIENKLFAEIIEEVRSLQQGEVLIGQQFFVNHIKPEIASLAADFLSKSYIHSPTWLANDIELVTEEENYKQELENTFTHIRRKKVDGLVDATIQELKTESDELKITEILFKLSALQEIRMKLNNVIGAVISR